MPKAYVITHRTLTNPDRFIKGYGSKVEATLKEFGGKFLVRGGEISYQEGKSTGDFTAVVEFPSRTAALAWESSSQYQAILKGRTENSTGVFIIIDGVPL